MSLANLLAVPAGTVCVTRVTEEEAERRNYYEDAQGREDTVTKTIRKNLYASEDLPISV